MTPMHLPDEPDRVRTDLAFERGEIPLYRRNVPRGGIVWCAHRGCRTHWHVRGAEPMLPAAAEAVRDSDGCEVWVCEGHTEEWRRGKTA